MRPLKATLVGLVSVVLLAAELSAQSLMVPSGVRTAVSTVQIVKNGVITPNPTYAHYKTPYASGVNSDVRAWAASKGLILTRGADEDRKDFAWRQTLYVNEWCSRNIPWNDLGLNSDCADGNCTGSSFDFSDTRTLFNTHGTKSTIIGGTFSNGGGLTSVGLLVERSKTTPAWKKLASGLSGGTDGILAMVEFNGELIVAGGFTSGSHVTRGTVTLGRIARWNGSYFQPFAVSSGGSVDFNNTVRSLAIFNGQLYAAGSFTTAAGVTVNRIARWNGTAWEALPSAQVSGAVGFNSAVFTLYPYQGKLLIGGQFSQVRGVATHNKLTCYDGGSTSEAFTWLDGTVGSGYGLTTNNFYSSTTEAPESTPAGTGHHVRVLFEYDNKLIIGGSFLAIGGVAYNQIASWNGSSFASLGTGVGSPAVDSGINPVTAPTNVFNYNGEMVIGGRFGSMGGVSNTKYIAKWNGSAWSALDIGISQTNNFVRAFHTIGSDLIVGLSLAAGGSDVGSYVQKWNGSAWSTFATGFNNPVTAFGEFRYNWSCGNVAKMAGSILMSLGIPTRSVNGLSPLGESDGAYEVYDARYNKWVLLFPHMHFWVEDSNGVPLSAAELRAYKVAGNLAITYSGFDFIFNAANGSGLVGKPGSTIKMPGPEALSIPAWCGRPSGYPGGYTLNQDYLLANLKVTYNWDVNTVPATGASVVNYDDGDGATPLVADLRDFSVSYPINQLRVSAVISGSNKVHITFQDNMYDAPLTYEMRRNGGSWGPSTLTLVSAGVYEWVPEYQNETLELRAVNSAGQQSNDVLLSWSSGAVSVATNGRAHNLEYNQSSNWAVYREIAACENIASAAAFNAIPDITLSGGRLGLHTLEVAIAFDLSSLTAPPETWNHTELFTLFQYVGDSVRLDGQLLSAVHTNTWLWNASAGSGQSQVVPQTWVQVGGARAGASVSRSIAARALPASVAGVPVCTFPELPAGRYKLIWHATTAGLLTDALVMVRYTQ